uniref:Uncharacterized protein n=1 Tax=Fibrocapsa japonica TaxID=94617 RepID=A0A7S2UV57_9STRA
MGDATSFFECLMSLLEDDACMKCQEEKLSAFYKESLVRILRITADAGCDIDMVQDDANPVQDITVRSVDRDFCLSVADYANPTQATVSKDLNRVANKVARVISYGSDQDIKALAVSLQADLTTLTQEWQLAADSQEKVFYEAMLSLLRDGFDGAKSYLTSDSSLRVHNAVAKLKGSYLNSFERLVSLLVETIGTGAGITSSEVLKGFSTWETQVRKNVTEPRWDALPKELTGPWMLMEGDAAMDFPGYDTEINQQIVYLNPDGTVKVDSESGEGIEWSLEPGPTHLDTVRFQVRAFGTGPEETILNYVGYIDRGQRLETKFSKQPVRMKGRLITTFRGNVRSTTAFRMLQKKD